MKKITLVTNIPVQYRISVFNKVAELYGGSFIVIYCGEAHPNINCDLHKIAHEHIFLRKYISAKEGFLSVFLHNDPNIIKQMNRIDPDIVITMGFNPTYIYAFLWTLFRGKIHIPMSDGTLISELRLTWMHRLVRRFVYRFSSRFIAASSGTRRLYVSCGIAEEKIFTSCLCIDNDRFFEYKDNAKKYDIMFSGRFIERKMPFFFVDVAEQLKKSIKNLQVLLIGSGPLKDKVLRRLEERGISYRFGGFISQDELPYYYSQSKLLLFPTLNDPWGIVANEACAVGMPVVTCLNAGAANDLVVHDVNGLILPLRVDIWTVKIAELLNDKNRYERMSKAAIEKVKLYNFDSAAKGILDACEAIG